MTFGAYITLSSHNSGEFSRLSTWLARHDSNLVIIVVFDNKLFIRCAFLIPIEVGLKTRCAVAHLD